MGTGFMASAVAGNSKCGGKMKKVTSQQIGVPGSSMIEDFLLPELISGHSLY